METVKSGTDYDHLLELCENFDSRKEEITPEEAKAILKDIMESDDYIIAQIESPHDIQPETEDYEDSSVKEDSCEDKLLKNTHLEDAILFLVKRADYRESRPLRSFTLEDVDNFVLGRVYGKRRLDLAKAINVREALIGYYVMRRVTTGRAIDRITEASLKRVKEELDLD